MLVGSSSQFLHRCSTFDLSGEGRSIEEPAAGVIDWHFMRGKMGVMIGVDIGGTKTGVVVGRGDSERIEVLGRAEFPTEPRTRSWRAALEQVTAEARRLA